MSRLLASESMELNIDQGRPLWKKIVCQWEVRLGWHAFEPTHPPSHAIFRFLLKNGFRSHAERPPGMDASAQIFSSANELQATRFSLLTIMTED